jgi:Tat protein translocase TatB subunit
MDLFGVGLPELFLIMLLALVVIGPEKLPEVASQVGRTVADLKRQANQLTSEFQQSLEIAAQERKDQRTASTTPLTAQTCPSCGAEAAGEAKFCASCGNSLTARPTDGERVS